MVHVKVCYPYMYVRTKNYRMHGVCQKQMANERESKGVIHFTSILNTAVKITIRYRVRLYPV